VGSLIVHDKPWNLYGYPQKKVLNYKIAIFLWPPMTQHGSDLVEISV